MAKIAYYFSDILTTVVCVCVMRTFHTFMPPDKNEDMMKDNFHAAVFKEEDLYF